MNDQLTAPPGQAYRLPMTPARRAALIIGLPLAVLLLGYAALNAVAWLGQGSYPVRLAIPVPGGGPATVSVTSGTLSLNAGTGPRLGVTGTARYAIFRSHVSWQPAGSGVTVRGECRQLTGPCSFDLAVAVPAGLPVRAFNASGDISVTGLPGSVYAEDTSGDITLSSVSGNVRAVAQSGSVTGSGLAGQRVDASGEAGDISLSELAAPQVNVSNMSGDITLTFTTVPDSVTVSDLSGNVTIVLPKGSTAYSVSASATSGTVFTGVPENSASRHVITVTDQSGDIRIVQ